MEYCDYGCGKEAKFYFKNGKKCCSSHYLKCESQKKKVTGENNPFFQKTHSKRSKKIMSEVNKNKIPWNKGVPRTKEEKELISKRTKEEMSKPENRKRFLENRPTTLKGKKHPNWSGGYYTRKLPLYSTYMPQLAYAEDCRQDPKDKKILQVKCTYCGKWFTPTTIQVYERIRSLCGKNYGEQRLYCSEKCKLECPIFGKISYPKGFKPATSREVQPELRQLRLEIDNYTCQKCGKNQEELDTGLHCHHIEGIRWEPLESADIDKVITYCKTCHIEVHKQNDCGYNDMKCGR